VYTKRIQTVYKFILDCLSWHRLQVKSIKSRLCNYYFITTIILKLDSHYVPLPSMVTKNIRATVPQLPRTTPVLYIFVVVDCENQTVVNIWSNIKFKMKLSNLNIIFYNNAMHSIVNLKFKEFNFFTNFPYHLSLLGYNFLHFFFNFRASKVKWICVWKC
jgi:hypothetical protein